MKTIHTYRFHLAVAFFALAAGCLLAGVEQQSARPPATDGNGRFWVYRNGPAQPLMPFTPYGWMSDSSNLTSVIQVDVECNDQPNPLVRTARSGATTPEKERCIRVKINWEDATWASVAFISGPDKPAWWGETNGGRYYNLTGLAKKKLIFFTRGERGGESIKTQIGALSGKPFGDSLSKPIVSEEIKLTKDWARHEIDLKDFTGAELSRICNGFGILVERVNQPGSPTDTLFYLDDVYFE